MFARIRSIIIVSLVCLFAFAANSLSRADVVSDFHDAAQGCMSCIYRDAAAKYREAAAKTKSAKNRSCYQSNAQYSDCQADQMGPHPPASCNQPTCTYEQEPSSSPSTGGGSTNSSNPKGGGATNANTGGNTGGNNTSPADALAKLNQQLADMEARKRRESQVEDQEAKEAEKLANLTAKDMISKDSKDSAKLLEGSSLADSLKLSAGAPDRNANNNDDGEPVDQIANRLNARSNDDSAYAGPNGSNTNSNTPIAPNTPNSPDGDTSGFYGKQDPNNQNLYGPDYKGADQGWSDKSGDIKLPAANEIPIGITFLGDGRVIEEYGPKAIPTVLEFNANGSSTSYGSDSTHPGPSIVNYDRNGNVTAVSGPIDDRVPIRVTYGPNGSIEKVEQGPPPQQRAPQPPAQSVDNTASNGSNATSNNGNSGQENRVLPPVPATNQTPGTFISQDGKENSNNKPPTNVDRPNETADSCPSFVPNRVCGTMKYTVDQANRGIETAKEFYRTNVKEPLDRLGTCLADPLECITHLNAATGKPDKK